MASVQTLWGRIVSRMLRSVNAVRGMGLLSPQKNARARERRAQVPLSPQMRAAASRGRRQSQVPCAPPAGQRLWSAVQDPDSQRAMGRTSAREGGRDKRTRLIKTSNFV